MSLLALGINHKTAPVDVRERVAFTPERMTDALHDLSTQPAVSEAAILSTCNRTELYCGVDDAGNEVVVDWLSRYHQLPRADLLPYIYSLPDQDAVRHMLRVASGLDSLVLGEPQILGQMKDAYQAASSAGTLGGQLSRLFQHTFAVAKQVRTDTEIGSSPVSVAFAAVSLARQIFGELNGQTALLIGAGETIELVARHLHENGLGQMIVANRTAERAHLLASQFDGFAIELAEIPGHLAQADIVISSTASPLPILGKGAVERALKQRRHRPMFMVDIAVPRDIEPEVGELADVYLYKVDDLREIIEENLASRREAALQAEEIIDNQVTRFMGWLRSLDAVETIRNYRDYAERTSEELVQRAQRKLRNGSSPEEALAWLAHNLANKLTHGPTVKLRQASFDDRGDLLAAARELFGIKTS
ncbi:MAG TPA: glutamyl-tRNA reductase [Gammaproteobacteria bacterium]